MECRKPAAIDRATALRYMGASGWQPDDATTALLDRAEEKILAAATPRAAVRRLPRAVFPPPELDCGTDLTRHLQGCDAVLLMAATLGEHVFPRYVEGKLREWDEYRMQVSGWELEKYMIRY